MNRILLRKPIRSFTKGKFWTTSMAMLLLFMVLSVSNVNAQIAITVTGNTNTTPNLATSYASLADALTALNAITGMIGPITFQALSAGSETAPNKGFTIGSATLNPLLSATNTISILGSGQSINAGIGTGTPASAAPDGIIKIVGADHVTLSYFILNDNNTTNPATMEYGIALFKLNNNDGCKNNIIRDFTINMKRINAVSGSSPMPNGATGIIMVNSTSTAAITALTPTTVSGANADNQFIANTIIGGINGIVLNGFSDVTPFTFSDYNNYIGTSVIENFGTDVAPAIPANGIATTNQFNINIEYNTIYNNNGFGVNHVGNLNGMLISGFNAVTPSITNNFIELRNGSTNFQCQGIINACGTGSTVNINNNTVQFGYPNGVNPAAVAIRGINNASVPTTLNINNNTIEGIAGVPIAGIGETNFIINNTNTVTPNVNTNNNIIRNFERTGASGTIYAIRIFATNWTANGNTIDNLKFSEVGSTGSINGLSTFGAVVNSTLNSNIIKNLSIPFTGTIYGIYEAGATGNKTMNSNQIYNFNTSAGGAGGSNFYAVYCLTGTTTIGNNSIYSLTISGNNASATSSVSGIRLDSPTNTVLNNKIYDLSANSTSGSSRGIFTSAGNTTLYNNLISDVRAPNTTSSNGVNGFITNGSASLYNNTILLNETVKNEPNTGSNVVFFNSSGTLISRNNIFINKSVVSGTGNASALYCTNFATTYDTSSNNNLLFAPVIFSDGTNTDTTLAAFKTRMATRDQNSVTETITPFISTVGSSLDFLRLPTNAVSVANNNALPITSPSITTDYFNVTRSTTTPDIGASEFNGLVCVAPTAFALNGGGNGCANPGVTVGLVNSQTGVNYQLKRNGVETGSLVAGTGTALAFGNQTFAGTYTVDAVSNVVGCSVPVSMTGNAVITLDPTSVGGSISGTKTVCNGQLSGTLTLSGNTGTIVRWEQAFSPFTSWTALTNTTNNFTSGALTLTTHYRAVSKSGSCPEVVSTPAIITINTISATSTRSQVTCNGGSNGAVSLFSVSGGTAPYTYLWNNGATTASISGLSAGTYSCTITDNAGCSRLFGGLVISQPTAISLAVGSQNNIDCFGGTGFASVAPSGGIAPYTYLWTGGGAAPSKSGLTVGFHTVTVTDANGCTATRLFTITQPIAVVSGSGTLTNVSCNGGSNGTINITPSGGIAPYTFNWGGGITTEDRTGLTVGNYSVTITDANGCTGNISGITITQPTAVLVATLTSKTNTSCSSNSGTATASATGGTAPYIYDWAPGIPAGDGTANVSGLGEGNYTCTITDSKGCSTQLNFLINKQSTTWNGSAWSNGTPNITTIAIFDGLYTATTNLSACSVSVSGTAVVTIPTGFNLTVNGGVMVAASATLTIESNANLVQISTATNTGNTIVKRDASMKRLDFTYWSSPIVNQNLLAFTPLTLTNRFFTLSETGNTFVQVASPSSTVFAPAKGYSLRAPNNFLDAPAPSQIFNGQFTGVPNNGDISIPVTFTAAPFGGNGYNLIGNPYPSTVDANAFLNANIGSLYFWTHQSYYAAGVLTNGGFANYAVYNLAGGTTAAATVLGGVNVLPNGFIQVGQGFMFKTNASKTITFTNSMREANNGNQFFRTVASGNNKLWLNLTNSNGFFSQTLVSYLPNTSTSFDDSFDAPQLNSTGLSTMISNEKYAIQSRGNFDVSDVVKLNINITTAGNYTISKDNLEGVFNTAQDFFLKDNVAGITHNIKQSPYNFVANAGEAASRFEIVYINALSNNNSIFNTENVIVFENNNFLNIAATQELKSVKIFDIQGRNIFETQNINANTVVLNTFRPQQQVLLIQITNSIDQVITKKVIF